MTEQPDTFPLIRRVADAEQGNRPTLIIDTREQAPLPFQRLTTIRGTLATGDYSFAGGQELFAVERKTLSDLIGCCTASRERFERELHRLRGYRFKRLLIVGTRQEIERGEYRSNIRPAAVLHSLAAWECRYDVPVVFEPTPEAAGARVEAWAFWFARELIEHTRSILAPGKGKADAETPAKQEHTP